MDKRIHLTGDQKLDDQHQVLIGLVDDLHLAIIESSHDRSPHIPESIARIAEFTRIHFHTEENFMLSHNYPDYVTHKIQHTVILRQAKDLSIQYREAINPPVRLSLMLPKFLRDWLHHHISGADKKMIDWILENQRS